uniref:putative pentatricopeptide repeat-containing protein At1g56570 n=1 Tax=Erigeron canadensis TaxID=72917 RepID=UPI001CB8FFC7|nr:putative pentatricopeptide repeat-containing protein At1g56570 [Erigeron canadensis]
MSHKNLLANKITVPIRNAAINVTQNSTTPFEQAKLSTNLIRAYFDNGLIKQARQLFDEMPDRDVVAWTSMIFGYTTCKTYNSAWLVFKDMMRESFDPPNAFTFSTVFKACKGMKSLSCGGSAHGLGLKHGFVGCNNSIYVDNALLDMYATCCVTMDNACLIFREICLKNQVSWTTLIAGFTHRDDGLSALQIFREMLMEETEQSAYSFSIAIRACAGVGSHTYGKQIHASVIKHGFDLNIPVMNSILDMYCKCNCFQEAEVCFNGMYEKDDITWNTLIAGYEKPDPMKALHLFVQMEFMGCAPNCFTFSSVIAACTNLSILTCGQQIHSAIFKRGHEQNLPLANSLIDMYAKSGSIQDSKKIFSEMSFRDLVSWTSMMIGFGSHGHGHEVIKLFNQMVNSGIKPDTIVFMAVLTACSHAGLVEEGLSYFKLMTSQYKISPNQEIYACVIDLFGRGGRIKEAYDMIQNMPFKPDESVWAAFLGACKAHGKPVMGKMTAQKVLDSRPKKAGIYVLLSNMYAAEGKWDDRAKMRKLLNKFGVKKVAGRSWVEIQNQLYSFVAGDRGGYHEQLVYEVLGVLGQHMAEKNYIPQIGD